MDESKETNRDRVRRLLFDPLGFRLPKGADADQHRETLNEIADELSHMAEENLITLRQMLQSKGEGSSRNHWPSRATFRGFAEIVQPRPVSEMPSLLRWFRSAEGPRAQMTGTLVETYLYFEKFKAPPRTSGAMAQVMDRARDNARRLQIIAERRAVGLSISAEDAAFERWYAEKLAYCRGLVEEQQRLKEGASA
jgi:hypothetical protein